MENSYKFKCETCGNPMVKAGKNSTGKQRYKCRICKARQVIKKTESVKKNELKLFVKWITDSTKAFDKIKLSRRTFHRRTRWCWNIVPQILPAANASKYIFVDATYINRNLCLLIVRDDQCVLNFKWAKSENFCDYHELLRTIKEPAFVICDGNFGIIKAARRLWKNAGMQRCLVHITRDAERKLGKRSPLEINHIFRRHIKKLHCADTVRKSEIWLGKFDELYNRHKEFIEELTLKIDEATGEAIRQDRTHKNLFSACYMVRNAIKKNMLFLYIENKIPNNSNCLEGGINSPLKNLLRCHRGISLEHQKRMLEWYLLTRSGTAINNFINSLDFDNLYPKNGN
jgi:hypothetical protein